MRRVIGSLSVGLLLIAAGAYLLAYLGANCLLQLLFSRSSYLNFKS